MLQKETKIGMTFGQIIAVISLLITMLGGWTNIKMDMAVMQNEQHNSKEWSTRHENQNKEDMRTLVLDVKESLREIKEDVKALKDRR